MSRHNHNTKTTNKSFASDVLASRSTDGERRENSTSHQYSKLYLGAGGVAGERYTDSKTKERRLGSHGTQKTSSRILVLTNAVEIWKPAVVTHSYVLTYGYIFWWFVLRRCKYEYLRLSTVDLRISGE